MLRILAIFVLLVSCFPRVPGLAAQMSTIQGEWIAVEGELHGVAIPEAALPLLRFTFEDDEGGWTVPGYPQEFDYEVYGAEPVDSLDFRLPTPGARSWVIPVVAGERGDTLVMAFPLTEPFDSADGSAPGRPDSTALSGSGPYMRVTLVRADGSVSAPALSPQEERAAAAVQAADIERRTRVLVDPEMEGRASGRHGGERAARRIADWFAEAGMEPGGDDGFLQRVPLFSGRAVPGSSLAIGDTTFRVGEDVAITGFPVRADLAMEAEVTGEVVLFGPSLGPGPAEAALPDLDVRGKVVAWVFGEVPGQRWAPDLMRTYEALHRSGAEAVIVLFPGPLPKPVLRSPLFDDVSALDVDLDGPRRPRPVLILGPAAYTSMFGDGSEVRAFMAGLEEGDYVVRPTGQEVTISYRVEETTSAPTFNVVGVIRGSDPDLRDEAVVLTAHYDAFGVSDGATYAGAADNALGVAELVEIAEALQSAGVRPRRSLVFLAVGAEERGMLGALHWVRHPTWPLDRVVANLNLDGGDTEAWGPLHGVIDLTRHATLGSTAAEVAAAHGIPLLPNDGPGGGYSDYYDFLRARIPAVQLMGIGGDPSLTMTRLNRFGSQRVHQPGDTIDSGWDWAGPTEMTRLYLQLALRVANADAPPSMKPGSPYAR